MTTAIRMALLGLSAVAAIVGQGAASVSAETVAQFYTGKTITIITSTGAGGPFDITARTIARHMGRHIPGHPLFIVKNMPGGGHTLATNYMASQAPKDGTTRSIATERASVTRMAFGRMAGHAVASLMVRS